MGDQNEGTKVMDAVIGVLAFCIVLACVLAMLAWSMRTEDKYVEDMNKTLNSNEMQRLREISEEFTSESVLCTSVANILAEFGDETILCFVLTAWDDTASPPGYKSTIYVWDTHDSLNINMPLATVDESDVPVEKVVKRLLSMSEKRCKVRIVDVDSDTDLPYVEIIVE